MSLHIVKDAMFLCAYEYILYFHNEYPHLIHRLFFRPEQSGLSKVEAAEKTLK